MFQRFYALCRKIVLDIINKMAEKSSAWYRRYTGYVDRKMCKTSRIQNCLVLENSKDVIIFAESLSGITSSYIDLNALQTKVDLTTLGRATVLVTIFRTSPFGADIIAKALKH